MFLLLLVLNDMMVEEVTAQPEGIMRVFMFVLCGTSASHCANADADADAFIQYP